MLKVKEKDPTIEIPKIYLACVMEDKLLISNRIYKEMFEKAGVDLTYKEGPGGHNWEFWNEYIQDVLDWLPLDEGKVGLSSGNVHTVES